QLRGRLVDGLAAARAHMVGAPHDERDEGLRHAGASRHVGDGRLVRLDLGRHWNVPPKDDALYAKYGRLERRPLDLTHGRALSMFDTRRSSSGRVECGTGSGWVCS